MGEKIVARKGLTVFADPALVFPSGSLLTPGPDIKFVCTVVPTAPGTIKRVLFDGPTGGPIEDREALLNQGNPLVAGERNVFEFAAPRFYQFNTSPISFNLRYSVNATFTIITIFAEKEHAATFLTGP